MSNYAPGWSSWTLTCSTCGGRYHLSGVDVCRCVECTRCAGWFAPEDLDDGMCRGCGNAADDEAGTFELPGLAS